MFGAPQPPMTGSNHPQIKMAKLEMQAVTDMFSKMTMMCHEKCFAGKSNFNSSDSDLNVGELACTDRCVGKYLEAQKKVGEVMNTFQQQQQQVQQAMQQQMASPPGTPGAPMAPTAPAASGSLGGLAGAFSGKG